MEALFKYQKNTNGYGGLTRYRCTNCRKHIIWVGECGGVNFGKTTEHAAKWPCPVCGIEIGQHEQYKPINLEQLDPRPIKIKNK